MGSINCREFSKTYDTHDNVVGKPKVENETVKQEEYDIEAIICDERDIPENTIKKVDIGLNLPVLVIKQNGVISAIGTKCSHYGAPLIQGVLGKGRIRCPWHGACFNLNTGDIEDFPGLDSIPCFKVNIVEGQVIISAKKSQFDNTKRIKIMSKRNLKNHKTYVIVGGGPAGAVCAETLRQQNFTGRIVMICKENALPYDRIKLSKSLSIDLDTIQFRQSEFYSEYDIETMIGIEATFLNAEDKKITCSNGFIIKYDKIFFATGSKPIIPNIEGANGLRNIVTLRSHEDAKKMYDNLMRNEMHVVCLGSSFISLEIAAYCVSIAKTVTVIGRSEVPLINSFGIQIGTRIAKLFEQNDVVILNNSGITKCIGEDGVINSVELIDGKNIPCDLLIMGTGSRGYTDFLKNSGLKINENGSIDTDLNLMSTTIQDIYIGGDIANAPVFSNPMDLATIGHFQLAQYHGRIAALNMMNIKTNLNTVPFFWTMLFNKNFRYAGYGEPFYVTIEGNLNELQFIAFFFDEKDFVIGMASCGRDPIVSQFAELRSQGRQLHKNDLKPYSLAWTEWLTKEHLPDSTGCSC